MKEWEKYLAQYLLAFSAMLIANKRNNSSNTKFHLQK